MSVLTTVLHNERLARAVLSRAEGAGKRARMEDRSPAYAMMEMEGRATPSGPPFYLSPQLTLSLSLHLPLPSSPPSLFTFLSISLPLSFNLPPCSPLFSLPSASSSSSPSISSPPFSSPSCPPSPLPPLLSISSPTWQHLAACLPTGRPSAEWCTQ
ncbi:unnamed protein product [Closterium sp. NIES-64]|nr:unnamed protein product [Closterium sp. NIES-64]